MKSRFGSDEALLMGKFSGSGKSDSRKTDAEYGHMIMWGQDNNDMALSNGAKSSVTAAKC